MLRNIIKTIKRKKFNLRQACVDKYGEEFGESYDSICQGIPIGGFIETVIFLNMVEQVKKDSGLY